MSICKRLAISAAEAFAGAVMISVIWPWVAKARRELRKLRRAA